jgi:hypothetical protein
VLWDFGWVCDFGGCSEDAIVERNVDLAFVVDALLDGVLGYYYRSTRKEKLEEKRRIQNIVYI